MINWAITLFVIGLIAIALGLGGIASAAMNIGYVLLVVGVILAIAHTIGKKA